MGDVCQRVKLISVAVCFISVIAAESLTGKSETLQQPDSSSNSVKLTKRDVDNDRYFNVNSDSRAKQEDFDDVNSSLDPINTIYDGDLQSLEPESTGDVYEPKSSENMFNYDTVGDVDSYRFIEKLDKSDEEGEINNKENEQLSEQDGDLIGELYKRLRAPMGFRGQLGKRAPMGFRGQLGKRAPMGFRGQLGKRAPMGFMGQLGKRAPMGFSGQLGKRAMMGFKGQLGKRAPMGFRGQLGKRAPMGFRGQLGKRAPMGFRGQLGKRAPMGFRGQLGKRWPMGFSGQLGKRAPMGFIGQLGKRAPLGFYGQLGKRIAPMGYFGQLGKRLSENENSVTSLRRKRNSELRYPSRWIRDVGHRRINLRFFPQLGKRSTKLDV